MQILNPLCTILCISDDTYRNSITVNLQSFNSNYKGQVQVSVNFPITRVLNDLCHYCLNGFHITEKIPLWSLQLSRITPWCTLFWILSDTLAHDKLLLVFDKFTKYVDRKCRGIMTSRIKFLVAKVLVN